MTGAVPLWSGVSDGDLARAAAEGDRQAFAEIYDRYADRLYDFCVGMVGDPDTAADCVQDAFCVAATDLGSLREPDNLRPWLYSIVRHHAMRRLRRRYREEVSDAVPEMASHEASPEAIAGQSELARLVAEAAGGLSDRDRNLLDLSYRHGLDGPELAQALGVTLTNANSMMFRLRQTVERSLGALLVARDARVNPAACPELVEIVKGWDGQFTVLMRKRIARHIGSCHTCEQEQQRRVNPVAMLGGAPMFIPAPDWLRDQTLDRVQLTSASSSMSNPADHLSKPPRIGRQTALLVGIPLICLGLTIAWFAPRQDASITPAVEISPSPRSDPPTPLTEATQSPSTPTGPVTTPTAGPTQIPPPTTQGQTIPDIRTPDPGPDPGTPEPSPEVVPDPNPDRPPEGEGEGPDPNPDPPPDGEGEKGPEWICSESVPSDCWLREPDPGGQDGGGQDALPPPDPDPDQGISCIPGYPCNPDGTIWIPDDVGGNNVDQLPKIPEITPVPQPIIPEITPVLPPPPILFCPNPIDGCPAIP